jgi:phage baseplate assembly protein W
VSRRTRSELEALHRRLGRDLLLSRSGPSGASDSDLAATGSPGPRGTVLDLAVAAEVPQAVQLLVNRLQTRRGELAPLGHPDYGSRHHELVGEPNTERTRNLVKLHVLEALRHEPRVEKVLRCVVRTLERERDVVRVELTVRLDAREQPLDLVLPVDLGGAT